VTAWVVSRPVAAEAPWLTVVNGCASFAVPADYIQKTMGDVSLVVVEGNLHAPFNESELGLTFSGDAWTAVIGPLAPGSYYYRITGDDTKVIKDPTNPTSVTSEPTWSTFFVAGDAARLLTDVPDGRGGTLETVTGTNGVPDEQQSLTVWTPPGYDAHRTEPYPVFYLHAGEDGSHTDWVDLGRARQIFDNLSIQGRMKPMVVVMGDGNVPDFDGELANVMRTVRRRYNIARDPAHQALAGVSMCGSQALRAALAHPGEFAYVGSFAGLLSDDDLQLDARAINTGTRLLRLYTGNVTDAAYNATYRLMRRFDSIGVRYEFDGVNPDVAHNWTAWQENLIDFVPRLFRVVPDRHPSPGHAPLNNEFTPAAADSTVTPWLTKDANCNTFATFETTTEFTEARHVTVWGNWAPGGSWLRVPLVRSGDRWRVTVGPLKPWFYHYQFIVDLVGKKDTANPTSITSEPTWSTFLVRGDPAHLLDDVRTGRGGTVDTLTYHSTVAGEQRTAYVWTPPGYDPHRRIPYPVLYLQHGSGQSYTDWVEMGRAKQILDNEYLDGELVPMVVVMGDGNVSDFTGELLENIVPAARTGYNISRDPAHQALAGLSMGGFQTYDVLKSHPGKFAYIGTFSAGLRSAEGLNPAAINKGTKLLSVYCGDVTDFLHTVVLGTLETFDNLGIRYEFDGPTQGPHGWDTWQKNLIDFAPRLFRHDVGRQSRDGT
jgi:enterochelin esterase-like enzyme